MQYTENLGLPIVEDNDSMSVVYTQGNETNQRLDIKLAGYDTIPTTLELLQENINSANTEIANVKKNMSNLENEINENVNSTLSNLNSKVEILTTKSLKGGISFNVSNDGNFSRTNPKFIDLTNIDIVTNFKDVLVGRNKFEFSFKNIGKYHLILSLPVQVVDLNAVGLLNLNLCKYPYTNGSTSAPNTTDTIIRGYSEMGGNLIIDSVINVTNLTDFYGFVLSALTYKEGYVLSEDDNDKLATLYIERIS